MKNVYLAQPTNNISGGVYLPYSVATIAAYAWEKDEIKNRYALKPFLFLKEDVEDAAAGLESPYLVGLSCYLWNIEYNLQLAKEIKALYPDCVIVAGGPQIPDDRTYLEKYACFDILIHGEGEVPFYRILRALAEDTPLAEIPNIAYRKNGEVLSTRKLPNPPLEDFPSPYTNGYFDDLIGDPKYAGLQFDALIETNRGCPYSCSYCAWSKKEKKVRCFPLEKIKAELDWISAHSIPYVFCADANFGLFERDEEIVDYLISLKKKNGFPQKIETMTAKNKAEFVFRLNKKMHDAGLAKGFPIAVQTMSPVVLKNIHRENFDVADMKAAFELYRSHNIPSYTDMIIGLPGETFESFCRGLFEVLECGQKFVNIFPFELLPNSELYDDEAREKYKLRSIKSFVCKNHGEVTEKNYLQDLYSEFVIATDTMSEEDWKKTYRMSITAQALYGLGLTYYISQYMKRTKNVSLYDFYVNFVEYSARTNGFFAGQLQYVTACLDDFVAGKSDLYFCDERFGHLYWPFEEGLFLCLICDPDKLYAETAAYIRNRYGVENGIADDLISFQKRSVNGMSSVGSDTASFAYDWYAYFKDPSLPSPAERPTRLTFGYKVFDSLPDYAKEIVWFGKRQQKMFVEPELCD